MSEQNKIGVELNLDGLKQIKQTLNKVGDAMKSTAEKSAQEFKKAEGEIKQSVDQTAEAGEQSASRITRAFRAAVAAIRAVVSRLPRLFLSLSVQSARIFGRTGLMAGRAFYNAFRGAVSGIRGLLTRAVGGVAIGGGGIFASVLQSSEFAELQARFARAGGTRLQAFGELSAIARQFGAENDELLGAFSTLSDKLAEAARGEGALEFFQKLGVEVLDANGQVRDTSEAFVDLTQALRRVRSESSRANFANELLGGDAEKLATVLGLSRREIEARSRLAREAGVVINPTQLARTRRFLDAWRGLQEVFRGLSITIAQRVYPILTSLFTELSKLIRENRNEIASFISRGFVRLAQVVLDVVNIIAGNDDRVRNTWLFALRDNLVALFNATKIILGSLAQIGPGLAESLKVGLEAIRDFSVAFISAFSGNQLAFDLFGTDVTKEDEIEKRFRLVKNIRDGRVTDRSTRFAREGERILPFTVDEDTANTATGFAGAIGRLRDALGGLFSRFDPAPLLNALSSIGHVIYTQVLPAINTIFLALLGDEQARRDIQFWFRTTLLNIRNEIDQWARSAGSVAQGVWFAVTGRYAELPADNPIVQLTNQLRNLYDASKTVLSAFLGDEAAQQKVVASFTNMLSMLSKAVDDFMKSSGPNAEALWFILTGRSAQLSDDNELGNQWKGAVTALTNIRDVFREVADLMGITTAELVVYLAALKSFGLLSLAATGIGKATAATLGGIVGALKPAAASAATGAAAGATATAGSTARGLLFRTAGAGGGVLTLGVLSAMLQEAFRKSGSMSEVPGELSKTADSWWKTVTNPGTWDLLSRGWTNFIDHIQSSMKEQFRWYKDGPMIMPELVPGIDPMRNRPELIKPARFNPVFSDPARSSPVFDWSESTAKFVVQIKDEAPVTVSAARRDVERLQTALARSNRLAIGN